MFDAMLRSPAAVSPAVPADRSYNCKVSSHSAAGVYEVTLDDGIDELECITTLTVDDSDPTATANITHTSDTVKVVHTNRAGVASDTVAFTVAFTRLPAGHP